MQVISNKSTYIIYSLIPLKMAKNTLEDSLTNHKSNIRVIKPKHLLAVLGLSSGTGLTEVDTLDRLNDVGAVSTPTSVSAAPGQCGIFCQIYSNPLFHRISSFFVSTGISGGPNNTLGILTAAALLGVGTIAARSYIHESTKFPSGYKSTSGSLYAKAAASLGLLAGGLYIGAQSFLPVVNDILYSAPVSNVVEGLIGAATIILGVDLGLSYMKQSRTKYVPAVKT